MNKNHVLKNTRHWHPALVLALILTLPAWLPAQTCYVSPTGAHADPFDSWGNAATNIQPALQATMTNGWNTVLVSTGVYILTERVNVTNNIIMRSLNNGRPDPDNTILDGDGLAGCMMVSNNSVVEGFTITRGQRGVLMYGGVVSNCIITENGGTNVEVWGAGAYLYNDAAIWNSRITANACGTNVGAAGVGLAGNSRLINSIISYNTNIRNGANVSYGGGGVRIVEGARMENCQIISNVSGSYGPGIYVAPGAGMTNIIRNCLITGNRNLHNGGGAGIAMVANGMDRMTLVQNCTVVSNFATTYGGGIYCRYNAQHFLENTIVYHNGQISAYKDYYRDNTAITSWWTNCCTSRTNDFTGENNTTNAPVFVNFTESDYRLPRDSFLVNAGINRDWMAGARDLDGRLRIDRISGLVDIGCYEYVARGTLYGIR